MKIALKEQKYNIHLFKAARDGKTQRVLTLLKAGINPNFADQDGWTPLHCAACNGYDEIVDLLITYGADKNACNNRKSTPLHWAAQKGRLGVVKTLLKHSADTTIQNKDHKRPIDFAVLNNHWMIAHLLSPKDEQEGTLRV